MKKKEYGTLFSKVAIASLSLIATGGIIAGVASYNNGNGVKKNTSVAKESTTEYKTTEKITENETEKKLEVSNKIKLNKSGQKEFTYLFTFYEDEKKYKTFDGAVEDKFYQDKEFTVGDYVFKWNSTTDKCVYYKKSGDSEFKKLSDVKLYATHKLDNYDGYITFDSEGSNLFATDGKVVLCEDNKDNNNVKLFKYNLETGEKTEIAVPEELRESDGKNSSYRYLAYKGILYIVEYVNNVAKYTYVYDISTGEYALLIKADVDDILNDYVLIKDYMYDKCFNHEKDYIKKITDNGLEDVMELEDCVVGNGADNRIWTFDKEIKNNESYTDESQRVDATTELYGRFDTKTGKFTLEEK